jgi:hypothetical protein
MKILLRPIGTAARAELEGSGSSRSSNLFKYGPMAEFFQPG